MTFFFDQNLSPRIAAGLREFGEDVVHLRDEFEQDADDHEWLPVVGDRGWVVLTRDDRIRHRHLEKAALKKHKVGIFVIGGKSLKAWDLIQVIVRHWPRIKELSSKTRRPFAFRVPPSGTKITKIPL